MLEAVDRADDPVGDLVDVDVVDELLLAVEVDELFMYGLSPSSIGKVSPQAPDCSSGRSPAKCFAFRVGLCASSTCSSPWASSSAGGARPEPGHSSGSSRAPAKA